MQRRIRTLEQQIQKVKTELLALKDLRAGSLSKQYNVCGTVGCRCKASPPRKHGPYYQVSFTRNGKSSTHSVRREHVATVRKQMRDHKKMRRLMSRWIDLATELSNLRLKADSADSD